MEINTTQLRNCSLFKGIDPADLSRMLNCLVSRVETYPKGSTIVLAGDDFHSLGVITEGHANVVQDLSDGRRILLNHLGSGDLFGELEAFSDTPWDSTVEAQDVCTVLFMDPARITGTCKNACPWHHSLIENLLERITFRTRILKRQVYYLTIRSLRGRIAALLLETSREAGNNTFMLPMNRNEMAGFLNVARPSLSREMAHMRDEGLISYYNSSVRILDADKLRIIAEN